MTWLISVTRGSVQGYSQMGLLQPVRQCDSTESYSFGTIKKDVSLAIGIPHCEYEITE